jgi:glucose-6-phosphate isomerase
MFSLAHETKPVSADLVQQCLQSLQHVLANKSLGFTQLPERHHLWEECKKTAAAWNGKVDQIFLLGTGGSSLGVRVITEMFSISKITYIDNVDPLHFKSQMETIRDPQRTGWIVASKTGTTIETLCALEMVMQLTQLSPYVAIISEKKNNSLANWATKNSYAHLEVPLDVGGRYSVLSPIGMFPAALAGLDLEKFRLGSQAALREQNMVAQLIAQTVTSFAREEWITLFWIYSSRGTFLGRWIQQLWAESLGKEKNLKGDKSPRVSTPVFALGTTDQHSTLQQMMEGENDKFYWFVRFSDLEKSEPIQKSHFPETEYLKGHSMGSLFGAEAQATQTALEQKGRSCICLKTENSDEEALGFFFMMMELVVAGVAQHLQINAFDQPGVELGKRLARDYFKTQV